MKFLLEQAKWNGRLRWHYYVLKNNPFYIHQPFDHEFTSEPSKSFQVKFS